MAISVLGHRAATAGVKSALYMPSHLYCLMPTGGWKLLCCSSQSPALIQYLNLIMTFILTVTLLTRAYTLIMTPPSYYFCSLLVTESGQQAYLAIWTGVRAVSLSASSTGSSASLR